MLATSKWWILVIYNFVERMSTPSRDG